MFWHFEFLMSRNIESPFIWTVTRVGDAVEAGTTHKEIYPLHTTSLLLIISRDVSESSVTLLISMCSPLFILLMRKEIEFRGRDAGAQGTIDGIEKVLEGDIDTLRRPDSDNPGKMYGSDGKGRKRWSGGHVNEQLTRKALIVVPDTGRMFHHVPIECWGFQQWVREKCGLWIFPSQFGGIRGVARKGTWKTSARCFLPRTSKQLGYCLGNPSDSDNVIPAMEDFWFRRHLLNDGVRRPGPQRSRSLGLSQNLHYILHIFMYIIFGDFVKGHGRN